MFDPSKEASLARKYEAAAERGFYRAIKELRLLQKQTRVLDMDTKAEIFRQELGSISEWRKMATAFDKNFAKYEAEAPVPARPAPKPVAPTPLAPRFSPPEASSTPVRDRQGTLTGRLTRWLAP